MAERRQRRNRPPMKKREPTFVEWNPKTKLGKMVKGGQIKTMSDALNTGLPIREPEIVDIVVETDKQTVEESKEIVLKALDRMGYLPNKHK